MNLDAALALSPEGGLAHRTFAFTYAGLARCLLRRHRGRRTFETFPQRIARKRVAGLGDAFAYGTDGLALFEVMHTYAVEYIDIFYTARRNRSATAMCARGGAS